MGYSGIRRWAPALLLAGLLLNGCGGGGGSSGGSDAGGDGGGGNPPPGSGLSGHLWHDDYALDFRDGAQIASPGGDPPMQVTAELTAQPWPDGSQYATADSDAVDSTDVRVVALATGAQLYQATFNGYLRDVRPSPVSKSVILATWGEDSISKAYAIVYDFASDQVLDLFELAQAPVSWLPDGRLLRVANDGTISVGEVGGAARTTASLAVPAGRQITSVSASPDGTKMLMSMAVFSNGGSLDESDLWLANVDGSGLTRLTNTHITGYGVWSPDSKLVAFDADTGLACGGGFCSGSCELWYGKVSAANLDALSENDTQARFRVKDRSGQTDVLGCDLQGWTP